MANQRNCILHETRREHEIDFVGDRDPAATLPDPTTTGPSLSWMMILLSSKDILDYASDSSDQKMWIAKGDVSVNLR